MDFYTEAERKIPIRKKVDVLVCGGGTAGVPAAVAAARKGAKTMMIERYGYPGGMFTGGYVTWCDGLFGIHPKTKEHMTVVGGIMSELRERAEAMGAMTVKNDWVFPPETNKLVMIQMMEEAGVNILFHAWIVDVIKEGSSVKGVVIESKSGREAILADVVVDCTGDADVAFKAGVPCKTTQHWAGPSLKYTTEMPDDTKEWFVEHQKEANALERKKREKLQKEKGFPFDAVPVPFIAMPFKLGERETLRNPLIGSGYDMVNVEDITKAEIVGRKLIYDNLNTWKKEFPVAEKMFIKSTAPQMGVRETRRIRGEYVLSAADIQSLRQFDDVVTKGPIFWELGHLLDIPYRCLLPVDVDGLLVAGRCLSATRQAADATRIIPTCVGMGQAAGTAAAIAVQNNQQVRAINVNGLQRELRNQNVELDLHFDSEDYTQKRQAKFHRWFEILDQIYSYQDEW